MARVSIRFAGFVLTLLLCAARAAEAQTTHQAEVTVFGGYRFGGEFYEIATGLPVDADGAAAFGVAVDIVLWRDTWIEAMVTHQQARFTVPSASGAADTRFRVTVDHYQVGGLTELGKGRARPFLTGALGLTRYAVSGDHELRLSGSAGGGVKLFPQPRVGLRLDGRLFATLVDAEAEALVCGSGICIGSIDAWVVWQAEFTAALVVRF